MYKSVLAGMIGCLAVSYSQAQTAAQKVPVGTGVYEVVYNPVDKAVYVATAGTRNTPGGYLYKLNTTDKVAVSDSIRLLEQPPFGLGLNTKTQILYTSNTRTNNVSAIDLKTKKVVATITNGKQESHTREVVVDEQSNTIYVTDVGEPSSIWIIDGNTNKYTGSIENTGVYTTGMALDAKNNQMFVTNMGPGEIGVIDLKTKKVAKSFKSGGEAPVNLILDDAARKLYVTNQKSGTVTILDADKGTLLDSIKTGDGAIGIGFYKSKKQLIVTNRGTGQTSVVDIESKKVVNQLETGTHPNSVAINQDNGIAYITNKGKSTRTKEGQPPPPKDENGDTVSIITL